MRFVSTSYQSYDPPEQSIWQIPITSLQRFEHIGVRCESNHEVADDHGRTEMGAIVEGAFADTFQIAVSCFGGFPAGWCKGAHWLRQAGYYFSM